MKVIDTVKGFGVKAVEVAKKVSAPTWIKAGVSVAAATAFAVVAHILTKDDDEVGEAEPSCSEAPNEEPEAAETESNE